MIACCQPYDQLKRNIGSSPLLILVTVSDNATQYNITMTTFVFLSHCAVWVHRAAGGNKSVNIFYIFLSDSLTQCM